MLIQIFKNILLMSAVGSVLAMIWLCLKPITRRLFSPSWQYYIWLTVLIVMISPVHFSVPSRASNITPVISEQTDNTPEKTMHSDNQTINFQVPKESENLSIPKTLIPQNMLYYPSMVWLLGMIAVIFAKIVKYTMFLMTIHKNSEIDTKVLDIPKRLSVRRTDMLDAPLIVGIFKPTLFLPSTPISENDMNYILMHELTHYKRGDLWYKWFAMAVQSVHWFNPFSYVVSRQIDTECEISCDCEVTKDLSVTEKNDYMNLILDLISNSKRSLRPLTTQMESDKNTLKRRFNMIKKQIKVNRKTAVISVVLAVIILATAVLASGILKGTLFREYNNEVISLNTDKITGTDFNLLFVGTDNGGRADTIMLLKVNEDNMLGLSIPRNTLVGNKRVLDIFADEDGNQAIIDAIKKKLSVPIHYYVEMNLSAVKDIVNSVGGIDYEVPMDMDYDDPYQDLHIELKKGRQKLNGEKACQLLQFRQGYPDGDLSRIQLHRQFLSEFMHQKLNKENIDKAPEIFKIISENIKTNYSVNNLEHDMKIINSINDIAFETIPGKISTHENMPVYELIN